jgi:hypothetical protein
MQAEYEVLGGIRLRENHVALAELRLNFTEGQKQMSKYTERAR